MQKGIFYFAKEYLLRLGCESFLQKRRGRNKAVYFRFI